MVIPFRRIPEKEAENALREMKESGEIIKGYKIKREGNYVLIPSRNGQEYGEFEEVKSSKMIHRGSFERISDFFVIKEREGWEKIFQEIISKQHPRAVFLDRGVTGNERKRNVTRIYGIGPPEGIHRENGIRLFVNIENAYFSPRLAGMRSHLLSRALEFPHDLVVDMYAGIGPISILFLKHGIKTVSFDINPHAIEMLRYNMILNRVNGNYAVTDSNIISSCFRRADQIVMNNPTQSKEISSGVIGNFREGMLIHYFVIEEKSTETRFNRTEIIEKIEVHGYSPRSSLFYYLLRVI